MSLSVGIVGLPNAGKSTLFNALLGHQVASTAPYPFCTIEPNVGVVSVPDERLEKLAAVLEPEEVIPAVIEFVDIAGLVEGSHRGEGLGNAFLSHIREVDAILHLVRGFEGDVTLVGSGDPKEDLEIVNLELVLKDLETVSRVRDAQLKAREPEKYAILERVAAVLEENRLASAAVLSPREEELIKDLNLLTLKPQLLVVNTGETTDTSRLVSRLSSDLEHIFGPLFICAKLEEELADFSPEERAEYLAGMGREDTGLDSIISGCYKLLNLITFYTIKGGRIVQAWPIREGSSVLEAAGLVHTDFAKEFIRAEVVRVEQLVEIGSWSEARNAGLIEVRGRGQPVRDGDVIEFKI